MRTKKNININKLKNYISITITPNNAKGLVNIQKENWQFQFIKYYLMFLKKKYLNSV